MAILTTKFVNAYENSMLEATELLVAIKYIKKF